MAVDQPRRQGNAVGIDGRGGAGQVEVAGSSDCADLAVDRNDSVGVEHRPGKIAAQHQADVLDDQLARAGGRRFLAPFYSPALRRGADWSIPQSRDRPSYRDPIGACHPISLDAIFFTPAAVMSSQAFAIEPLMSMPRQASSTT